MKSIAPRTIILGTVIALVVLGIMAMGARSRDASAASNAAIRELQPTMRLAAQAQTQCIAGRAPAPGVVEDKPCSTTELLESRIGAELGLRASRGCIAPQSVCAVVEDGRLHIELVTRAIPEVGGLRVEAEGPANGLRLDWQCRPLRASVDAGLVREACGDIPVAKP